MKDISTLLSHDYVPALVNRLVRYCTLDTQSDRHIEDIPSTPRQWELARLLMEELKSLGLSDVALDEHCYLIARLPATLGCESLPCFALMAHMDTASDVPGSPVKPRVIEEIGRASWRETV